MRFAPMLALGVACLAAPDALAREAEECWNPRAAHYERVRPGERQDDLDFRHCRPVYSGHGQPSWYSGPRECWNPRAGHFEEVRRGERQDDLDFSRCHPKGWRSGYGGPKSSGERECWNPRAGHYERVRPGERQDDLDFNRCRAIR